MNVTCFGDSNTYGYDPRGYFGGRYDADSRWVDILAAETGWTVHNMGQNGREIPSTAPAFPADTDLLIVMLGTNDLLQGRSPDQAAERLGWFLSGISLDRSKLLLIAPPPAGDPAGMPAAGGGVGGSGGHRRDVHRRPQRGRGPGAAPAGGEDCPAAVRLPLLQRRGCRPAQPGGRRPPDRPGPPEPGRAAGSRHPGLLPDVKP